MTWQQRLYDGEVMGKFWEKTLLTKKRYTENLFINDLLKDGSVLDVGCGPGQHLAYLSKYQQVVGLDLSKYLITRAKKECKENGDYRNVDLIRVPIENLPFQSNTFDNVMNILSFGFYSDEKNEYFFAEMIRLLKKHGRYIHQFYNHPQSSLPLDWELSYPDAPSGFFVKKRRKYNPETRRVHIKETVQVVNSGKKKHFDFENRIYTARELIKLHRKNGLKITGLFGSLVKEKLDEQKFALATIVSEKK